jgi:p-aminobenzoyl-glutamate transporter AbgT
MQAEMVTFFTLDRWYLWSQIAVVLCGLAVFITGKLVSDRDTEKSERLSKELIALNTSFEEQHEKTAKAELQLKMLADRQAPRVSFAGELAETIKG